MGVYNIENLFIDIHSYELETEVLSPTQSVRGEKN